MKIQHVRIRRFKGLERAGVEDCAGLNILIGRNNAGKSTVLSAIELALDRISSEIIAAPIKRSRPRDEFFEKNEENGFEIALTFQDAAEFNKTALKSISTKNPSISSAIENLSEADQFSIILSGYMHEGEIHTGVRSICAGDVLEVGEQFQPSGIVLMDLKEETLQQISDQHLQMTSLESDIKALGKRDRAFTDYAIRDGMSAMTRRRLRDNYLRGTSSETRSIISQIIDDAETPASIEPAISQFLDELKEKKEIFQTLELDSEITTILGRTTNIPDFVFQIIKQLSGQTMLSFKEQRPPIGQQEAVQLMRLKTKRGGGEDLKRIQEIVKELLGVQIDAFEPDDDARWRGIDGPTAEMDVDDFLVEANGAGIREALRIILDLELKKPDFALIEEPEVHLHPGLERVLHQYLVEKSANTQLFVATHSANFLDASARQNIYLVTRNKDRVGIVERVATEDDLIKISDDVGLKPSTVLMFDNLIFVEGPSDENIFRALAKKLDLDFSVSNTAFVIMGGSSRFSQFAAEAILELLSRRRVKLTFVLDRDESERQEVEKIVQRAGDNATVYILERRELENYLIDPVAVASRIKDKSMTSKNPTNPSSEEVTEAIKSAAAALKNKSIELRINRKVMRPIRIYEFEGTLPEKIKMAKAQTESMLEELDSIERDITSEFEEKWNEKTMLAIAPGSLILNDVFHRFGLRYRKDIDPQRIVTGMSRAAVPSELRKIIEHCAKYD